MRYMLECNRRERCIFYTKKIKIEMECRYKVAILIVEIFFMRNFCRIRIGANINFSSFA